MMRAGWLLIGGGLLLAGCTGCRPTERPLQNIVLTGSAIMAPLLSEIGKRFEADHPGVRVDVQIGGSMRGIGDTRQGLADVGMIARSLKPDEAILHATPIARDAMCIIVNRTNPVTALSNEQIASMYTRGAANWKQVGGPDLPIMLVHMKDGQALLDLFLDYFKLRSTQIRADALIQDSEQGVQAVASQPGAIAYVSCSRAQAVGANVPIKVLPAGGIKPSMEAVREGTYPLSRPLQLVTRETPKGLTSQFIEFARSQAVRDLIHKHHFVTLEK